MKKLLLLIPVLALAACGQKSYTYEAFYDIEVVAEARDGVEAVAEARRTKPDVALMDLRMPRMDGLEALKQIANDVRVVVCTTFDHDEYVHTALKNGACGFLLKDAGSNLLIEAVRAAVTGDRRREARRRRQDERRDRAGTVHLDRHGEDPPGERSDQTGRTQPSGDRRLGVGNQVVGQK